MLSIDISDTNMYMVDLKVGKRKVQVGELRSIPFNPKALMLGENTINREVLTKYLNKLFRNTKEKDIAITFSLLSPMSNDYVIPVIKKEEQRMELIRSKCFQYVSEAEYALDYCITENHKEKEKKLKEKKKKQKGKGKEKEAKKEEEEVTQSQEPTCSITAYYAPKQLVTDVRDVLLDLGKKPKLFHVTQSSIFKFAKSYLPEKTLIIANITQKQLTLHLINHHSIITKNSYMDDESDMDVLGGIRGDDNDTTAQISNNISRLMQYQAIKNVGTNIEAVYLMGELADRRLKVGLSADIDSKVMLLSEVSFPFKLKQEVFSGYIYAMSVAF